MTLLGVQSRERTQEPGEARSVADTGARVLFHVNHPAQVHLFRNAIDELRARGHETFVTSRKKEVTVELLDAYGIEHDPLTARGRSFPSLVRELLVREVRLLSVARRFDPDVLVSRLSPAAAHVSAVVGRPFVAVTDTHIDGAAIRRVYESVTFPFVDRVCAPPGLDLPVAPEKREHLGFQELAYLHPRYFEPDGSVLVRHGVDPDSPYFVVRMAAWDAYHDVGHRGLSPDAARSLVASLSEHGDVYVSAEGQLPAELSAHRLPTPPEAVHQLLYFADLYVGDSGTMSTEAALLGTPAIRTNSMVGEGDEDVFRELEERYGILRSFRDVDEAVAAAERHVESDTDRAAWRNKRDRIVEDRPDVTERIVETILEATGH